VKIVFWGTPEYAVPTFHSLLENGHEIVGVVTQPDKRRSRGKKLSYSPIKKVALDKKIPIFTPQKIKTDLKIQNQIFELNADIFIVVAFGQLLPKSILDHPPFGCWNIHASILPRWRGAAPIQYSLISGDKYTGVAIMHMEEGLDTGPVLIQEKIEIKNNDNYQVLSDRLSQLSSKLIINAVDLIKEKGIISLSERIKKLKMISQEKLYGDVEYASLIKKEDLLIEWDSSSLDIHRKVMGLYPNAYTYWEGKRIKILSTYYSLKDFCDQFYIDRIRNIIERNRFKRPGTIVDVSNKYGIIVLTSDLPIIIIEAQLEGKRPAGKSNLINQLKASTGKLFKSI
tara:strand:+ start:2686 stop:3708 length:1023 start_codon:yes stop_codon:yes gene_type:complete